MATTADCTTVSHAEVERFAAAIKGNGALAAAYDGARTPAELAHRLRQDGYDVTEIDLLEHLGRALVSEGMVPDDQLDAVSGGLIAYANLRAWRNPATLLGFP